MKRILLFVLTNLAVVLVLGTTANLLGVTHYLRGGLNLASLMGYCLVFGFGGAFLSLWMSRPMAKWSTGARVISGAEGRTERWLVDTVAYQAQKAGIAMPEVAIYEDDAPNAFATGATRNSALVAVSTGLLASMDAHEVEAVLAHEVSHAAGGDMVTMTLLQGVMNTFVMFAARVVGYFVDRVLLKNDKDDVGIGYTITVFVLDMVFGLLAAMIVAAFSRHREYRADAGAAALMGQAQSMISALQTLGRGRESALPKNLAAFGIAGGGLVALFATHPSIDDRIAALRKAQAN